MLRTNKELADWIYYGVQQGQHEEVGSFDSELMNGHEVMIQVASGNDNEEDKYCEVTIDNGATYSACFAPSTTIESILESVSKVNIAKMAME